MWSKFLGLMGRDPRAFPDGAGLWLPESNGIHMMFMRFAIDAVFYDRDTTVTKVSRGVRPWIGLSAGGRKAKGVIELPVGAAESVQPGDKLSIER